MPEGEVIDLTDLPDDPPAPVGLDPQQRNMANQLLNTYPLQSLRDTLRRLLERQEAVIQLAVYQSLLASGDSPVAVQGSPPAVHGVPPGMRYPYQGAHVVNPPAPAPVPIPGHHAPTSLPRILYSKHHLWGVYFPVNENENDQQLEVCTRCSEEFDAEDDSDSCSYHPGM